MAADRLFDEPSLSRQWVLRRLQRALTTDLAAAAFQRGIGNSCGTRDTKRVGDLADAAQGRAAAVREMILGEGGAPYQSIGLARGCAGLAGRFLGRFGRWTYGRPLRMIAEHTLSEYDLLVAYLQDAPGVSADLAARAEPLLTSARAAHDAISRP